MKKFIIIALIIIVVSFLSKITDAAPVPIFNAQYCDMVQMGKSTSGKYGWPDYNNNYNQICIGSK